MFRIFHGTSNQFQRVALVFVAGIILIIMSIHFSEPLAPLNYEKSDFLISSLLKPMARKIQKQNIRISEPLVTAKKTCAPQVTLNKSYLEKSAQELKNTNAEIDNLRQTAQNTGETYQSFDSQANAIFTAYDQQVTATYAAYITALNGCTSSEPHPIIFSMFTP